MLHKHTNINVDGLECGGAYMKLLQDNKALHAEEFSNSSPYIIMFGPDKCGATNKVYCFDGYFYAKR